MDATGGTWIDTSAAGAGLRALVFVLIVGAGALAGWTLVDVVRRNRARAARAARDLMGTPERPEWAPGDWPCARCRSVNRPSATRCVKCRGHRANVELHLPEPEREPDIIPPMLTPGPVALVLLEHDPAAHTRALNGHWLLRIDGVVAGSAATRNGAAALLLALAETPLVMADPKGEGYARHPREVLAAAFASTGPLPYAGPCPEQTRRPTSPR